VLIDRPDPADESDDVGTTWDARSSDEPDTIGKDLEKEAASNGFPTPSPALLDTASRVERTLTYSATVEAVYMEYETGRGRGTAKEHVRETVSVAMCHVEAEDEGRHQAGSGTRPPEEGRPAEVLHCRVSPAGDGSTPEGQRRMSRDPVTSDNDGRVFWETTVGDATVVQDDGPYCPVSELKADEPSTADRLMESPEFTGKNLRGFKDTRNPDFVDDYNRTYDAVAGPTAWTKPQLNMDRLIYQIYRHIYEKDGIDFTVLDLTGASGAQIDEVFKNLDGWASNPEMRPKNKLIILGGGY
jgi:hypothetical protein